MPCLRVCGLPGRNSGEQPGPSGSWLRLQRNRVRAKYWAPYLAINLDLQSRSEDSEGTKTAWRSEGTSRVCEGLSLKANLESRCLIFRGILIFGVQTGFGVQTDFGVRWVWDASRCPMISGKCGYQLLPWFWGRRFKINGCFGGNYRAQHLRKAWAKPNKSVASLVSFLPKLFVHGSNVPVRPTGGPSWPSWPRD